MLEDKVFFMVRAQNICGELIENFEGGRNAWMTLDEINEQPKKFHGVGDPPTDYTGNGLSYVERKFEYDSTDY